MPYRSMIQFAIKVVVMPTLVRAGLEYYTVSLGYCNVRFI